MGFQMLTGEVPFLAESMVGVIQHHYMTPVPDILQVRAEVPKELLDVIYCSLNKDPADRFGTTKDMATALENIPMSDKDAAEIDAILRQLSAGQPIPKVRTGTLPPLSLTISGPGPRVQPRPATQPKPRTAPALAIPKKKKKKKNKALLAGMGMMMMLTLSGGGYMAISQSRANTLKQQREATARADSITRAVEASKGSKVIAGLPDGGSIILDGRPYKNGEVFKAEARIYDGSAEATGYVTLPQRVIIEGGVHDTLRISMTLQSVADEAARQAQRLAAGNQPRAQAADSNRVRFVVFPLHADVSVDGNKIGSGRGERWIRLGTHTVRYSTQGCQAQEISVTVVKGDVMVLDPVRLTC